MNRFLSAFSCCMAGMLIVSCTGETVDYSEPPTSYVLPEVAPPTIASAPLATIPAETVGHFNDFSLKFYLANSEGSRKNVCVSPLSVGAVLGMIANGDDGEARDEILKLLGFEESAEGLNALNIYYQTFISNLPNIEEDITCDMTNTLWSDPSEYNIMKSFMQTITDSYYAYGIGISPYGATGKDAINSFVSKNTNGLIDEFLKSPLSVSLAFLNTFYFKASWSVYFDERLTSKRTFLDIGGKEKNVDFMCKTDFLEYAVTDDGTTAVRLDYGERLQFSMTCILPSQKINHIPLDEVLTADNINAINKKMERTTLTVRLPKFEVETNNPETLGVLRDLGLKKVCSVENPAPFALISESGPLYLNCFIHSTKLKVHENGTEGAAASLAGMWATSYPGQEIRPVPEIVFDRPFIFYIQENTTGAVLFIGSVKTFS